jgi:hypothetical protein
MRSKSQLWGVARPPTRVTAMVIQLLMEVIEYCLQVKGAGHRYDSS